MKTVKEKVAQVIETYGSQKAAADALCVSTRFLSYLAKGQRNIHPGLERLMDLAIDQPELFK